MCNHHHARLREYFCDDAVPARLDELYYKDIMGEIIPNGTAGAKNGKLPYRDWAPLIPSVHYETTRGNTMKFVVPSGRNGWETYIQFDDWFAQVDDRQITATEAARLILWGANVKLHCGCPAFSYWGFKYILDQMDASIEHEDRYPHIRNPDLKGIACKHLIRTLKVLPFHLGDMAATIKAQRAKGHDAQVMPKTAAPVLPPKTNG